MESDMIPASKVFELFGIPRAGIRELAERGVVRSVSRKIDICHTMKFYSSTDIARFIEQGASDDADC